MLRIKGLIIIVSFICVASFAQKADSTTTKNLPTTVSTSATVSKTDDQKGLKKANSIHRTTTNTTWTKIKDLFM